MSSMRLSSCQQLKVASSWLTKAINLFSTKEAETAPHLTIDAHSITLLSKINLLSIKSRSNKRFINSSRCYARLKFDSSEKLCSILRDHNHMPTGSVYNDGIDVTDSIVLKPTNRGSQSVFLDNFRFVQCSTNRNAVHYRCTNYKRKCRARVVIKDEKARLTNSHNHS